QRTHPPAHRHLRQRLAGSTQRRRGPDHQLGGSGSDHQPGDAAQTWPRASGQSVGIGPLVRIQRPGPADVPLGNRPVPPARPVRRTRPVRREPVMSLTPETRVLLTDALRPPAGHHVTTAVGTTYSLDLTALLLAPMSFALFDQFDLDEQVDPLRLLDAVRRYSQDITVFCQAGGIHVPAQYRNILTFTEDSVLEVLPRHEHALFHPKLWALRFETEDGAAHHRVIVLS